MDEECCGYVLPFAGPPVGSASTCNPVFSGRVKVLIVRPGMVQQWGCIRHQRYWLNLHEGYGIGKVAYHHFRDQDWILS